MTQVNQTALENYLRTAKQAGNPADQVRNFVDAGYVALPHMLPFHAAARQADETLGPFWIGLGGARGPGKSHAELAQVGLDDCQRFEGLKWLFLRKIQKSAGESLEDLVGRVLQSVPYEFSASAGRVDFPNTGSRIVVGGYKDEGDIDKYVGIEYDGMVIEELNQISEKKVTALRGSIRTSRTDWRPRSYVSFNPGGIGHLMVKEHFVLPHRTGRQHKFLGGLTAFFPSTYRDNPFLDAGFVDYLEAIPGPLGKAWRDGDFDTFEGMAFPSWNQELHVIEPFVIPEVWPKWRAVDWGYAVPFSCHWYAKIPGLDRIYVYREVYGPGLVDAEQAVLIREMTPPHEQISITYADPSMFNKRKWLGLDKSSADEYRENGVILTPANNDRIAGKRKVDNRLAMRPDGLPGIQFFSNCHHMIRTLPALPLDEHNVEDVDTDAEDHAFDELKYSLTNERVHIPQQQRQTVSPLTQVQHL